MELQLFCKSVSLCNKTFPDDTVQGLVVKWSMSHHVRVSGYDLSYDWAGILTIDPSTKVYLAFAEMGG